VQRRVPADDVPVEVEDLRALDAGLREAARQRAIDAWAVPPMPLEGPLCRMWVGRTGDASLTLLLLVHHVVCDAGGLAALMTDLAAVYGAELRGAPVPPAPPFGQLDVAAWQRAAAAAPDVEERVRMRRLHLGRPAPLALPFDDPPEGRRVVDMVPLPMGPEELAALDAIAAAAGATRFQTLFAVYAASMHCLTGANDLPLGIVHAGLRSFLAEAASMVGNFINHLPLRLRAEANAPFSRMVEAARGELMHAYANADLPAQLLVDRSDPLADPWFQAIFNYLPQAAATQGARPWTLKRGQVLETAPKLPFVWRIIDGGSGVVSHLFLDGRRFTRPRGIAIGAVFSGVVRRAVETRGAVTMAELVASQNLAHVLSL